MTIPQILRAAADITDDEIRELRDIAAASKPRDSATIVACNIALSVESIAPKYRAKCARKLAALGKP